MRLTNSGNSSIKQDRKAESAEAYRIAARALEEMPRRTPADWYNLACVQARSAAAIGEGKPNRRTEAKSDRLRLADAAMTPSLGPSTAYRKQPTKSATTPIWNPSAAAPISRTWSFARKPPRRPPRSPSAVDSGSLEEKLEEPASCPGGTARLVKEDPEPTEPG